MRVVLFGILIGFATAALAVFIPWLPTQASEEAGRIDFVFWFVTWICVTIFALVAAVTVYSVWKFRAAPDDDSDGPPVHGHTGLEIAWTAVPAILVTAIGVVSSVALAQNDNLADDHVTVEVAAQQFAWSFAYVPPGGNAADNRLYCRLPWKPEGELEGTLYEEGEGRDCKRTNVLRLPLGTDVELKLTSRDVIHSFFVAEFRQKQDALQGMVTRVIVSPTKTGRFAVGCFELCGLGHSTMRTTAIVVGARDYARFVGERPVGTAAGASPEGESVFADNGCGSCHTFEPAGTSAVQGPDLDQLPALARRAGRPLEEFTRESILAPGEYVERGYPDIMPRTYEELPDRELDALVQYLVEGSRGGR